MTAIRTKSSSQSEEHIAMKFLICALALVAAASAAPQQYVQGSVPQPLTKEGTATILRSVSDQKEDGSFQWSFDTENGISAGETNVPKAAGPNGESAPNVQGGYQYTAPNGEHIVVTYKAGEEGFVAEGSHIPVAPPIPEEILKSLAWNAAHPEEEAQWDPAYNQKAIRN